MKLLAIFCSLTIGSTAAFVPSTTSKVLNSLRMSEVEVPLPDVKSDVKEKVPCFGATPLGGKPVFIGENYWDKITLDWGSEVTGSYVRAAELKHGRSAMLATLGFAFHKLGLTFDNISVHEYLSVSQNVKFADLAAMSPVDAIKAVPPEGLAQMFCFIAVFEIYELTHKDGKLAEDYRIAPGLTPGGLTGDLGWNPLKIKITDRRRLSELQNGRAAMFCISAWVANEAISGSFPLPLPW